MYTANLSAEDENAHTTTTQAEQRDNTSATHAFLQRTPQTTATTERRAPQNRRSPGTLRARKKKQAPQIRTAAPKNVRESAQHMRNSQQRPTVKSQKANRTVTRARARKVSIARATKQKMTHEGRRLTPETASATVQKKTGHSKTCTEQIAVHEIEAVATEDM